MLVDWLLALPEELEGQLRLEVAQFEEEETMPYVTSFERIATAKGVEQGHRQGLEQGLELGESREARSSLYEVLQARLGSLPEVLGSVIDALEDVERLRSMRRQALYAGSREELLEMVERWTHPA